MIRASFGSHAQQLVLFSCTGHAGYAAFGEDIVCASVSSAVQMAANLLTECFHVPATVTVEDNRISIALPENPPDCACRILEGLLLQFQLLQEEFPKRIKIQRTEV